ncbi:MAG: radical SAM family heme chaperone HemW [Ferruginibacter sp.]
MAGIYIHIPFCRQACAYCNFHFSTLQQQNDEMMECIAREILLPDDFITDREKIESIYFGGGTPSIIKPEVIGHLLEIMYKKFSVAPLAEITLEANPDDISGQTLLQWKKMGINRLSVGIQSFGEAELKWMNRAHSAAESHSCLDAVNEAGFENYSADLIYGSPLQSNEQLQKNARILFEKKVPHISCYALTVEPKTALHHLISKQKSPDVDTAKQAEQFELLLKEMKAHGYEQYEISNFSLPGFRSRHNSSYWQRKPYYGYGPAAHSFNGLNKRRWNVANNALYMRSLQQNMIPYEEETLTAVQQLNEYIMISLRTCEGMEIEKVKNEFGAAYSDVILQKSKKYIDQHKMISENGFLLLTDAGKFFADGIAADLFF